MSHDLLAALLRHYENPEDAGDAYIRTLNAIAVAKRKSLVQALEAERYSHIKSHARTKQVKEERPLDSPPGSIQVDQAAITGRNYTADDRRGL